MASGRVGSGSAGCGEPGAVVIDYWQGDFQLVAFGARDAGSLLPQDEATAATVLGAILARNMDRDRWPGEYRAVVLAGDGGVPVEVTEDDPRVRVAREWLSRFGRHDYSATELSEARVAVLTLGSELGTEGASAVSGEGGV